MNSFAGRSEAGNRVLAVHEQQATIEELQEEVKRLKENQAH
ncbi:MAG TPA: hypothetical protein PKH94_11695 [Bacteroidales bacterium]|nr:hypothetical protein [Bacteroidales bacterium]HNS47894.1 hypothetical protein [Bacteroidales bacterium]